MGWCVAWGGEGGEEEEEEEEEEGGSRREVRAAASATSRPGEQPAGAAEVDDPIAAQLSLFLTCNAVFLFFPPLGLNLFRLFFVDWKLLGYSYE